MTDLRDLGEKPMKLYVLYDTDSGEELAYHGENGDTLYRWRKDAEREGRNVSVKVKVVE